MRTTVSRCGDGPDEAWDGFPVAFARAAPNSLSVFVYLAAAFAVVAVPAVRRRLARYPRSSTAVLWGIAVPTVASLVWLFSLDPFMHPVGFGDVGCPCGESALGAGPRDQVFSGVGELVFEELA